MEKGQRFTLRDGTKTLGTGVITKVLPNLTPEDKSLVIEGKKAIEAKERKKAHGK